jgi:parvulin-like peptidyl-prolyl isomerase
MYKIFLSLLLSITVYAQLVDGVAIIVKGEAITLYEINKKINTLKINANTASNILIREKLEELEIKERKISVSSSEIYDNIKLLATRNNMSVSQFYKTAVRTQGMNSTQIKKRMKEKLLTKKLYSAVAYTQMKRPSEEDVKEYFKLHIGYFSHPSGFNVVIYQSKSLNLLQQKIDNPMLYSPDVVSSAKKLIYSEISPELANLLTKTQVGTFTTIIPDGKGSHMSFYIKEVLSTRKVTLKESRNLVRTMIMSEKREQVLSEYFARLRTNADIKYLRKP